MYTPIGNTHNRHSRVREMLKHAYSSKSLPPTSTTSESLVQGTPRYSQAFASTMQDQSGGGHSDQEGSRFNISSINNPHNQNIFAFVCGGTVLTTLFIAIGRKVDGLIQDYEKTENDTKDYQTHLLMLVIQLCFNVALLIVPYVALCKYYPESYLTKYYLIIAAFWVISLQAQPFLKHRFYSVFGSESPDSEVKTPEQHRPVRSEQSDQELIGQYLQEAEAETENRTTTQQPTTQQLPTDTSYLQYNSPSNASPSASSSYTQKNKPMEFDSRDLMPPMQSSPPPPEPFHTPAMNGTNIADLF